MFRAPRPRGEQPHPAREQAAATISVETLLALSLCVVVVLACVAFLRRSSQYSRALERLQSESLRQKRSRARLAPAATDVSPRPEILILVVLDGLRADRLGLYGHERETAPHLRTLGDEGVVFTTAAAQASWALASLKSLFTGKYPTTLMLEETGADALELARESEPRAFLERTFTRVEEELAQELLAGGFRTAAFTGGGTVGKASGFAQGFEVFDDTGGGLGASSARALAWLDQSGGTPSFLFLQTHDLACPYPAPTRFEAAFCGNHGQHRDLAGLCARADLDGSLTADVRLALSDHYDAAIRGMDEQLGSFLADLRGREIYDRAMIVVTSSHGEGLGEHGLVGHGGLYPEMLLVPLILKFPSSWNLHQATVTEPVELVDLFPTLLQLCGRPAAHDLDGRSLLPTLLRGVRGREYLVAQSTYDSTQGVRANPAVRTLLRPGRWQVIQDSTIDESSFLALDADPLGRFALPVEPEEFAPLLDVLLGREPPVPERIDPHFAPSPEPPRFDPELALELHQLGYDTAPIAGPGQASGLR